MHTLNPLLFDEMQMKHRELNGEHHAPHYAEIARIQAAALPSAAPQFRRSIDISSIDISLDLGSLSDRFSQLLKTYWYVPAGFAVLVLARSILGG